MPVAHDGQEEFLQEQTGQPETGDECLVGAVVTDHTSGTIFVMYVTGGETGGNLAEVITAMVLRESDPFHGAPFIAMLTPVQPIRGRYMNLCHALRIRVQINKPHGPRAKGRSRKRRTS
jgi:hypothetical protein